MRPDCLTDVFAWRSSKHQAYYGVKENCGDRPLSMPAGKGAASVVHAAMVSALLRTLAKACDAQRCRLDSADVIDLNGAVTLLPYSE